MPELPEVETVVRGLRGPLTGRTVTASAVYTLKIRTVVPIGLTAALKGAKIIAVDRRAKYILIHLDTGLSLIIHLGMTGNMRLIKDVKKHVAQKHDHLWFLLDDGTGVVFSDPRRFGVIDLLPTAELAAAKAFRHLGPEPLERAFTGEVLSGILRGRKTAVKIALMNQENVVGVGNIYASEALFHAGISPLKEARLVRGERANLLCAMIKKVLKASIRAGGSSLKDYRQASGDIGFFQNRFAVYDRAGEKCPGCTCDITKTGGIKKIVQGGRSTFYCPRKQS